MNRELSKAIGKLKKKIEAVPVMVEDSCKNIAVKAQSDAPAGVTVSSSGNSIKAEGKWAAYYEFGTGAFAAAYIPANLPTNWDEYAYTFYIDGKGKIKEEPYLFPAYETERVELIKKIKESFK